MGFFILNLLLLFISQVLEAFHSDGFSQSIWIDGDFLEQVLLYGHYHNLLNWDPMAVVGLGDNCGARPQLGVHYHIAT